MPITDHTAYDRLKSNLISAIMI